MNWIRKSRGFQSGESSDPADETVINTAPYDSRRAAPDSQIGSMSQTLPVPDDHTAEEIKRRQVSLALRYIMAVRARWRTATIHN